MPNWSEWWSADYAGGAFELFGLSHLSAVVALGLCIAYFVWARHRLGPTARWRWRVGLAVALLLNDVARHVWYWDNGQWSIQTMLPLHLCSLMAYLTAYLLLTGHYAVFEFMYFAGLAGASQAFVTPTLGVYGFPHFHYWQYLIWHGLIIVGVLYMTLVEGYRPTRASLVKAVVLVNVLLLVVALANGVLGSNYMFLARKPAEASAMDVLGPWPWYLVVMEGIGLVLFVLLYLPFARRGANLAARP